MSPERARARKAALDFIVDENGVHFVAAGSEGLQEGGRGDVDAAFALNGLDDNTASLFCHELFDRGFVIVGAVFEAGDHGAEGFLILRIWGRA